MSKRLGRRLPGQSWPRRSTAARAPRAGQLGLSLLALSLLALSCGSPPAPPPASPPPAHAPGGGDPRTSHGLLAAEAKRARDAGAGPLERLAQGAHIPGDSLGAFVALRQDECILVLARGSRDVVDLDLYAFSDEGAELGRDEAPDEAPTLLFCNPTEERAYVAARVAQGSGLVSLGVQRVAPSRADAVLAALGRSHPQKRAAEAWPGLIPLLAEHRELLGGRWDTQRQVAVPVDSRIPTQLSAVVPPDRCLDAFVLVEGETREIELVVQDEQGQTVSRGQERGRSRFSVLCSSEMERIVHLSLRPHSGRGTALVVLSQTTDPSERRQLQAEISAVDLVAPRHLREAPSEPAASSKAKRQKGATTFGPIELAVGRLQLLEIPLVGCSRVDLTAHYPLIGPKVIAHDAEGRLLVEHSSLGSSSIFLCARANAPSSQPPRSEELSLTRDLQSRWGKAATTSAQPKERVRLTAEATRRAGPLELTLRTNRPAPAALFELPLAASALLGLAFDLGLIEEPADIGRVERLELEADQLTRVQLAIPTQRCMSILAALDRGAPGLSLTAIDSSTGLVIDHRTAQRAAALRVCGDVGGTRSFVVELKTADSPASGLLATRLTPLPQVASSHSHPPAP